MFRDGLVRAHYDESKSSEAQKFAKEPNAHRYEFRFDNRLVAMDGAWWRAFDELGLTVVSPKQSYLDGKVPPMGLRYGDGFDVVGFVMPEAHSGITQDLQDRELYVDAALCSWNDEGTALQLLLQPRNYSLKGTSLDEELAVTWGNGDLRLAVSTLRWLGWDDNDIEATYESGRRAGYELQMRELDKQVESCIRQLSAEKLSAWKIRAVEGDLQRYCKDFDQLNQLLGTSELGHLPEAVALLSERQENEQHTYRRA